MAIFWVRAALLGRVRGAISAVFYGSEVGLEVGMVGWVGFLEGLLSVADQAAESNLASGGEGEILDRWWFWDQNNARC